jgi:hypothetical protein
MAGRPAASARSGGMLAPMHGASPRAARGGILVASLLVWAAVTATQEPVSIADTFFDGLGHPAIQYASRPVDDPVARLNAALTRGEVMLRRDRQFGHLPSLLEALDIDPASQIVVFSKTSLQAPRITPANPRLVFFNDSVAVAWPAGGFIELAAQDPRQGIVFYELRTDTVDGPVPVRQHQCLNCHVAYGTLHVPGMLVRSVATDEGGGLRPWFGNALTTHRTPFEERWAGWYVTGDSGRIRHLGNGLVPRGLERGASLTPAASSLASLAGRVAPGTTLTPYSDIAALLVFDHQMHVMNLLTRTGWEARALIADGRPDRHVRLAQLAEALADDLLFVGEAPLAAPVRSTSGFADRFGARGPHDRQGRSLRQLDLTRRLMRYPCSYMIHTEAFDALPAELKEAVYLRLFAILSGLPGSDGDERYAHLSAADRRAILEILHDTKTDLPAAFRPGA